METITIPMDEYIALQASVDNAELFREQLKEIENNA